MGSDQIPTNICHKHEPRIIITKVEMRKGDLEMEGGTWSGRGMKLKINKDV